MNTEAMSTIFDEIAVSVKRNENSHPLFVGTRDSNAAFCDLFLSDAMNVLGVWPEGPYGELVSLCATCIEWMCFIRERHATAEWDDNDFDAQEKLMEFFECHPELEELEAAFNRILRLSKNNQAVTRK